MDTGENCLENNAFRVWGKGNTTILINLGMEIWSRRSRRLLGHVNPAYLEVDPEVGAPRLACWNKLEILERSSDNPRMHACAARLCSGNSLLFSRVIQRCPKEVITASVQRLQHRNISLLTLSRVLGVERVADHLQKSARKKENPSDELKLSRFGKTSC